MLREACIQARSLRECCSVNNSNGAISDLVRAASENLCVFWHLHLSIFVTDDCQYVTTYRDQNTHA